MFSGFWGIGVCEIQVIGFVCMGRALAVLEDVPRKESSSDRLFGRYPYVDQGEYVSRVRR